MTGLEMLAHQFECPECGAEPGARCVDVKPVLHLARYDVGRASIVADADPYTPGRELPLLSVHNERHGAPTAV